MDCAASGGAYGKPNSRFSTVSLDKLGYGLQFVHSRLDNCAEGRAVTHTLHNRTNTDESVILFKKDLKKELRKGKTSPGWVKIQSLHWVNFKPLPAPDREKSFQIKTGDRMEPGISIGNSEVGLSSLTLAAFVLRLICTNGLISKTNVDSSYRHVSHRILNEFPQVLHQISTDLDRQRNQWSISIESPVDDPEHTIRSFNRQYNLNKTEEEAVTWAWSHESGRTMFQVVNAYTKAAQYPQLPTESEYRLQKVGGSILSLLN